MKRRARVGDSRSAILTRQPATEVVAIDGDSAAFVARLGRIARLGPREAEEATDDWLAGPMPADVRMDPTQDNANIRTSRAHIAPGEDVYADDRAFGDDEVAGPPVGRDR